MLRRPVWFRFAVHSVGDATFSAPWIEILIRLCFSLPLFFASMMGPILLKKTHENECSAERFVGDQSLSFFFFQIGLVHRSFGAFRSASPFKPGSFC